MNYYIGIDLGTTSCKSGLYDESGRRLAFFSKEYPLITNGGFVEQSPKAWWEIVKESIKSACESAGVYKIKAISVSSQSITVVPVDKNGNCIAGAISWLDTRAQAQAQKLELDFGKENIYNKTGKHINAVYSLPKIKWLLENNETVKQNAVKFLFPLDYLNFKFTGKAVTDYTVASGSMLFNLSKRKWDDTLMSWCGINADMLPEVKNTGESAGKILPEVARELGINEDIEIIVGGQDQKLSAIAAGLDGQTAAVSLGTATAVTVLSDKRTHNSGWPKFALNDKEDIYESAVSSTGASVKWLKNILNIDGYQEFDRLGLEAAGSGGARFKVDFTDGAAVENLSLSVSAGNLIYALYESICGEIAERLSKFKLIKKLKVFGGGAKSKLWRKLLEEKTGFKTDFLEEADIAVFGAAQIAAGGFKIK